MAPVAAIVDGIESPRAEILLTIRSSSLNGQISSLGPIPSLRKKDEDEDDDDDEIKLQWAVIERLPTTKRLRSSLFPHGDAETEGTVKQVDVKKLGPLERHLLIENLIKNVEEDNRRFLERQSERIRRVGLKFPTIEVRYKNVGVEARCDRKAFPNMWNTIKGTLMGTGTEKSHDLKPQEENISILKDVSGIIKPSRMTLLLGPPGCGKTTLLLALAGKISQPRKVTGEISYNGTKLEEFAPEKTSAYINQYDLHIPKMTVRETLDFAARCQGVGSRADIMMEVSRREKQEGIIPNCDIDTYMKAIAVEGLQGSIQTDYILKILGLDTCSDTMAGDAMRRGLSGGQKKRLTTGEMIVGPTRALFMDEISNGLDSSTTFQIICCLQQLVHITELTALVSLLQPAPETFDLFDDVILLAEGKIIYQGPRSLVLGFFEDCGFRCPERKGIADFLQEVISRKDQAQYWYNTNIPYNYVAPEQFSKRFKECHIGEKLDKELLEPFDKSQSHQKALSFSMYSLRKWEILKTCMAREFLLMKRDSFVYVFKTTQLGIIALITMTVFIRTQMDVDSEHSNYYMGAMFYTLIRIATNGMAEIAFTVSRLPVFYRQRDLHFYPAWAYAIPASVLKIPVSLVESFIWTALTYYVTGYSPEASRFFSQFLLLFALHQMSTSLYRFLASICRTQTIALSAGNLTLLLCCLFCGFILPRTSLPAWLEWGFWISPITYAEIGIALNEFKAPRWQKISSGNMTLGQQALINHGLNFEGYFYWLSLGALFGFTVIFNLGFTLALSYLSPPRTSRAVISQQQISSLQEGKDNISIKKLENKSTVVPSVIATRRDGRVVLPFTPLTVAFQDVQYFIDTPQVMREKGFTHKKLQLLSDITGAFRPGMLTALMGVSGAGKTTLMDVLSGRKTGGFIEGDIRIGGYPKVQKTFARVSGYCEQSDIHSPNVTVKESLVFSAWLRLSPEIDPSTKREFVEEVLQTIELENIKDALVGTPGVSGLSTEQRKRLTIAVELVANPSIIFMDEPTSGLDARAAAIVMRAVKNIVDTGRTVVCTIHQPSINIFESFTELLLMKRGGQIIYWGPMGWHSSKLIEYFEGIPGVPKIKENHNPAAWMLDITSTSIEQQLGVDFAQIYKKSTLYQENRAIVERLSKPSTGSKDLEFLTRFPQNRWGQYKACVWKQHHSYWRSFTYNLVRLIYMVVLSITFGAAFWQHGKKINYEQDVFSIIGSIFLPVIFFGLNSSTTALPIVATERIVLYREKFAGMYSSWAYSLAQVTVEVPYIILQAILFVGIIYPLIGFYWSAFKVLWFFYAIFCSLLCATYLGMLLMSLSPSTEVASVLTAATYTLLNLFSGFLLPRPKIPRWWVWLYWVCPTSWTLNGLLTSQYGDVTKEILAYGEATPINTFMSDVYGFRHDQLGLVAFMIAFFPLAFAFLFAYFIAKLNYQRR